MHSKGFHRLVLQSILVAFLYNCVSTADEYKCPYNIHVNKGQIIKARESVSNGASFLKHSAVMDARECYKLCCERKNCDLAQMQYKNSTVGRFLQVEKICYMFYCGNPNKCRFGEHDHYATIYYDRPDEKLSHLDSGQYEIPPEKVDKPKWNVKPEYKPSVPKDDVKGKDVGYKPPLRQPVKEQEQYKDLSSSWKPQSKEESAEHTKKMQEFGEAKYHNENTKKPVVSNEPLKTALEKAESKHSEKSKESGHPFYQEVLTRHREMPTKHIQVETKAATVSAEKVTEKKSQAQVPPSRGDLDDMDAELERKLEELTPSEKDNNDNRPYKPVVPDVKAEPTTLPTTFHHWRQFVDNNPDYPYTIPMVKKPTVKPTTEEWHEPITEHRTTKKTTTTKQQVITETPKTTEKTTTTEKAKAHVADEVLTHAKPPVLEVPIQSNNISDVVVIETHRLRIIENKAVLPLAIFLVLAILLLFVVALRLRIVKSKLKRRPFATDDADYLINGMYL